MEAQIETERVVEEVSKSTHNDDVFVVSRVMVNYFVIAIVFMLLGIGIGAIGFSNVADSNELLIDNAIEAAWARQSEEMTSVISTTIKGETDQIAAAVAANAGSGGAPSAAPAEDVRFVVETDGQPSIGPDDAPIVIVEFSDYQCGYCKRFHDQTFAAILENYEGRVKFVYRDFAILGDMSTVAAIAGECANQQGKFWEYHELIFANQGAYSNELFISLATSLELDVEQFTTCVTDQETLPQINEDFAAARDIGARGTPAFTINGKLVSGAQPFANFATIIDAELAALEAEAADGETEEAQG